MNQFIFAVLFYFICSSLAERLGVIQETGTSWLPWIVPAGQHD